MAYGREPSFTETFGELSSSNFLGGLILKAQGDVLKSQSIATKKIISSFSQRLQELESTPLTVDEQLAALNKDPDVKKSFKSLQETIGDYEALTYNIYNRQMMLNKIYGDTINALSGVGGETAGRLVESLGREQGIKNEELQRLQRLPLQTAEYKKTLLDIENTKFNLEEGNFKLQELRDDADALKLFRDMINSDEFASLQLAFNQATGKTKYNFCRTIIG